MSNVKRLQIDISEKSFERLKALKEKSDASSYAEVTNKAYRVYDFLLMLCEMVRTSNLLTKRAMRLWLSSSKFRIKGLNLLFKRNVLEREKAALPGGFFMPVDHLHLP